MLFLPSQVQRHPAGRGVIYSDFFKAIQYSDQKRTRGLESDGFDGNLTSAILQLCNPFEPWFPHLQHGKNSISFMRLSFLLKRLNEMMLKKHRSHDRCLLLVDSGDCYLLWSLVISTQDMVGVDDPVRY